MQHDVIRKALVAACVGAGALFAACNEKATSPMQHDMQASALVCKATRSRVVRSACRLGANGTTASGGGRSVRPSTLREMNTPR